MFEVRVLGPIELLDGGAPMRIPPAEQTLLAALAARVGEPVAVDVLSDALWPQGAPPSGRKSLQAHIVRLRRALGSRSIVERDGSYRLDPEVVEVDATSVTGLATQAREALRGGDPATAAGLLARAAASFRGPPYDGVPECAVPVGEVQRLVELRDAITEDSAEADLDRGLGAPRVGELEAFVQANPYRERAWGLLMRALYQAGRPADALAAFGRARLLLAADLGIEPGSALRAIERAVLDHDPTLLAPAAGSIGLGPANLPAPLTAIVGRQLELSVIGSMLVTERLVTLTGVGGIGKTRLALELAAQASGRYGVGPYFVDLAPIADVGLAPGAVATALGVDVEPNQVVTTAIREALGDQDVVVVVDNCEHLLPGIADLVVGLLAANGGVRVLATSREALGVPGERACPIDPLAVPGADVSVEQIGASDADALLLARLPMNLTTGPLTPDELVAVGAICRAVAGIPLGIELAAARCRTLSLPELAQRLERSIQELEPVRHGVVARHRTLSAALDWGFDLLSPVARDALPAMSVFAGGCDASAFGRICVDPPNDGDELLDELVRTSFVTVELDGRTRYRLLEPVRQYARDLLDAGGGVAERRRLHLAHYLDLARTLTNDIDQIGFDTRWDEVKLELGNFRAGLDWGVDDPPSIDSGLRLASRLWDLWASEPQHDEGLTRLVGLLATGGGSAPARSEAAYAAGFLAANILGDTGRGLELWRQALDEAAAGADGPGEVRARRILAICALSVGDVAEARDHLERAIAIAAADGHEVLHAYCQLALGELLSATGHLEDAAGQIEDVLARHAGDAVSVPAYAHIELAEVRLRQGRYEEAVTSVGQVLILGRSHPMPQFEVMAHLALVGIGCATGDVPEAATHLAAAEAMSPATVKGWDPSFLMARAEVALLRGDNDQALTLAEQVAALVADSVDGALRDTAAELLGRALLAGGRAAEALVTFDRLIDDDPEERFPWRLANSRDGAAAAAAELGDLALARGHVVAADAIRRRSGSQRVARAAIDDRLGPITTSHDVEVRLGEV